MSTITAADVADILVHTLENLGRFKMTDIISTYQNTIAWKRLAKKSKLKFDGGDRCQFNLITDHNDSARAVGLFYVAEPSTKNVLTTGSVDWRYLTFNWAVERRIIAMNRGSANKILDYVKTQRISAYASNVLFWESRFWRCPPAGDNLNIFGVPYWVPIDTTGTDAETDTTNEGFNGTAFTGYTTVAGINPSAVGISPKWNAYTDQYTDVSNDDLVKKLELASDYTNFMPLVDDIPTYNMGDDYGYYTTRDVRYQFKEILKTQNDNLGFDLDPVANKLVYRRAPVVWVKELDSHPSKPIYGINWGVFFLKVMSGEWMHETVFAELPNQPTTAATHVDTMCNTYCVDRRRNFVIASGTTEFS